MVNGNDALVTRRLQKFWRRFSALACGAVLSACAGPAGPITIPPPITTWPPDEPGQPERLGTPLPNGADPLVWWKATFFDTLPEAIYPDPASAQLATSLIKQTNERRKVNGLSGVSRDPLLDRVAQAHAIDEATRDYWNHRSPEGMGSRDRVRAAGGLTVTAGGENSAVADVLTAQTASLVVRSFEDHAGHRELLLHSGVQRIGIGVYRYAPDEQAHLVQLLMTY